MEIGKDESWGESEKERMRNEKNYDDCVALV